MRVITLDINGKVIGVKTVGDSYVLQANDIATDLGEIGQIRQADGSFITPVVIPAIPQPAVEDRLTGIEDTQDLILLRLEGVIV